MELYEWGHLSQQTYVARRASLNDLLRTIPPGVPEGVANRVEQAVVGIRLVSDLLPQYADMRDEVVPSITIIRRLVERIDLTPDRQPLFTWAPQVAETLALARLAGIDTEPPGEEGRDWMSPREVEEALGLTKTKVERFIRVGTIPSQEIKRPHSIRRRIPMEWVERQKVDPQPLEPARPVLPAASDLTPKQAAQHLDVGYRALLDYLRSGEIESAQTGEGKRTRYLIPAKAIQSEAVQDLIRRSRTRRKPRFGKIRPLPPVSTASGISMWADS
jgi:hypothetical protein